MGLAKKNSAAGVPCDPLEIELAQSPSRLFDEIAELFASAPQQAQILSFKPSDASIRRAGELLELRRTGQVTEDVSQELEQFEQAELLIRLVKARIRAGQAPGNSE